MAIFAAIIVGRWLSILSKWEQIAVLSVAFICFADIAWWIFQAKNVARCESAAKLRRSLRRLPRGIELSSRSCLALFHSFFLF
jgi:hypothetical protein